MYNNFKKLTGSGVIGKWRKYLILKMVPNFQEERREEDFEFKGKRLCESNYLFARESLFEQPACAIFLI